MIKTGTYAPRKTNRPKNKMHRSAKAPLAKGVRLEVSTRSPIHVHDIFLNCCRKEYTDVEVVTTSGEIIEGVIDGYDKDTIVLHNDMTQILIYKSGISYIEPRNGKTVILRESEMDEVKAFLDNENYIIENR